MERSMMLRRIVLIRVGFEKRKEDDGWGVI